MSQPERPFEKLDDLRALAEEHERCLMFRTRGTEWAEPVMLDTHHQANDGQQGLICLRIHELASDGLAVFLIRPDDFLAFLARELAQIEQELLESEARDERD